ncbi:hypothetical protein ZWY2020_014642 [Hordeum vulgare]|nr:hypothetical protein ZWY2020_014642 [Hordeum vulgare]
MDAIPPHLQQERRRCGAVDAARKRSSHKWTGRGLPMPVSLLRRETEEFDIRQSLVTAPAPPCSPPPEFEAGSSSGTWTLSITASSPYTPAREVAVDEDGFEIYDPAAFEGSVTREDFVPEEVLATVTGMVATRSAEEVEHDDKRRRREVDIDQLFSWPTPRACRPSSPSSQVGLFAARCKLPPYSVLLLSRVLHHPPLSTLLPVPCLLSSFAATSQP